MGHSDLEAYEIKAVQSLIERLEGVKKKKLMAAKECIKDFVSKLPEDNKGYRTTRLIVSFTQDYMGKIERTKQDKELRKTVDKLYDDYFDVSSLIVKLRDSLESEFKSMEE